MIETVTNETGDTMDAGSVAAAQQKLLKSIPLQWADSGHDRLTHTEQNELSRLLALGFVELRVDVTIREKPGDSTPIGQPFFYVVHGKGIRLGIYNQAAVDAGLADAKGVRPDDLHCVLGAAVHQVRLTAAGEEARLKISEGISAADILKDRLKSPPKFSCERLSSIPSAAIAPTAPVKSTTRKSPSPEPSPAFGRPVTTDALAEYAIKRKGEGATWPLVAFEWNRDHTDDNDQTAGKVRGTVARYKKRLAEQKKTKPKRK